MRKSNFKDRPKKEFDELMLEVRRVTRVTTWWRKMSFRATVLVGNKKGKIGIGVAKGPDVSAAVQKASAEAYKKLFVVPITRTNTVPYPVTYKYKYKSCLIKLLPASSGTGLKAGSSVRSVLEFAGYENILSKIIGSNNKLNNALATIYALSKYKHKDHFNKLLGGSNKVDVDKVVKESKEEKDDEKKKVVKKTEKKVTTKKTSKKDDEKKKIVKKDDEKKKVVKKTVKKDAVKKEENKKETK